ncbi:Helicase of the DEAD superfamily, RAD3, partial [Pseudoloma neurophilia]
RSAMEKGKGHGGIVCFVPSKAFLECFKTIFTQQIDQKLPYHFEDLKSFERDCRTRSTVLFSVMGGRLSEGINFSDNFCRMLFVIGLPFPSMTTEINERIKFYGKNFLVNIAMKTVNQSLGRALRHKNDFASIVLIDQRYENHIEMLSPWIQEKIKKSIFQDVFKQTHSFLKEQTEKYFNSKQK